MSKKTRKNNKPQQQELARILYVQGYLQKDIADKLGVSEVSVSRWARNGNWKTLKTNLLMSRDQRLAELYEELAEFNRMIKDKTEYKVPTSQQADARRKLISDIESLEKKYNVGQTISIGRDFANFVKDVDFDLAKQIVDYFDSFINHTISKQKWQE